MSTAARLTTGDVPSLGIRVVFENAGSLPASFIAQTLQLIENESFRLEQGELEVILDTLREIQDKDRQACRQRLAEFGGRTIVVDRIESGSIVVVAAMTALAYWIVENTVGETVKDAYKESGLHETLKNILVRRNKRKAEDLRHSIWQKTFAPISDPKVVTTVRLVSEDGGSGLRLDVSTTLTERIELPPKTEDFYRGPINATAQGNKKRQGGNSRRRKRR